jgi:hypothetical protein
MISKFYQTTATIYRNVWTTDKDDNDISEEVSQGAVSGHLQQAGAELIQNLSDRFTLSHLFWCSPTANIQNGDTVVISGDKYSVRAIQDNSFVGSNKHLEVLLEKIPDEQGS